MRRGEGQGAEHRYLVAHRYVTAAEMPPPYPNPRAEFREGGPEGTHWFHGTDVPFKGPLKPTERDYGNSSTDDTHWNTDLGVHFTSSHDLARSFARNFAGTDSATPEHARIAHATLHMRNPADFETEHDLADHAIRTARRHGLGYGETDDPELQDVNDGHEDEVSLLKKDHWLNSHPHREQIVHHVERELKKAGHDGIVYGNSYEGSPGDKSAIAFRDTPVAIHHWEHLHEGHQGLNHARTAGKTASGYLEPLDEAQRGMYLHHPVWHQDLGSEEDATRSFQHLLRQGGHPEADDAEAFKHPNPGWHQSQLSRGDVGQLTAAVHPDRWDYGTLAHETAHALHQLQTGEKPASREHAHDDEFMEHYRTVGNMISPGAGDDLHAAYHRARYGKEAHVREAGKGKPRRDAPDVDRRAQAPSDDAARGVDAHPGGDADGPAAHLDEHPQVARDLKKLHPRLRSVYDERVDGLRDGNPHSSTHALSGALSGWQGTNLDWRHRLVHRTVGDALHVLSVGVHDAAYDQGERRTGMLRTAEIRMVPPEEFGRFSYPDYPQARTPSQLVKHFKKTSPEYYHKIRDDVQRNGFTTPVLVRYKDGGGRALKKPQVMEGHHRAAVAHDLGVHLPVGDYDNGADYDEAFSGGQRWFRDNARPNGDMPGKEGALRDGDLSLAHRPDARVARHAAPQPLPTGDDFFYRFHHKDTPFGPQHARSYGMHGDDEPQKGYSSFRSPHDLHHYLHAMDWVDEPEEVGFRDRHVIGFRGTQVGQGLDKEPLAVPRGHEPDLKIGWDEFQRRLPATPGHAQWDVGHAKRAGYTPPAERLFGRTYGLDKRLWDGERLKEPVRADILATFDAFCARHGLVGHEAWAKVVFFGSEASEWTSADLTGNDDFDLSVGVQYRIFRDRNRSFSGLSDAEIADRLTRLMHAELNDPHKRFPGGVEGTFDQTWFCNLLGWDIAEIRPYAAWDVAAQEWIVRPPSLPDWSMKDFPEGPGAAQEVKGIVEMAEGILAMPEPYRTQNGAALWEFVHSNRSDAFGPNGEGWFDMRNVVEKAIDQKGLLQPLWECHRRAQEHPESLAAPADWSNSPA